MRKQGYLIIFMIVLMLSITIFSPITIQAGNSNNYYDYTYTVEMSQTQVRANETFLAHVRSQGTCRENIPVNIGRGVVTARITAKLQGQNVSAILNDDFQMNFDSIPSEVGQTFEKEMSVPLAFPAGSQIGKYDVIAVTTGAYFQVMGFWMDVTDYLPGDPISVGPIEYLGVGSGENTSVPVTTTTVKASLPVETITPTPQKSGTPSVSPDTGNSSGGNNFPKLVWQIVGGISGLGILVGLALWKSNINARGKKRQ